jgi:hypothetical protein
MLLDGPSPDNRGPPGEPTKGPRRAAYECRQRVAYDLVVPTFALLIGLAVALLVLVPTRRLQLAGWRRDVLTGYFAAVWLLGVVVAIVPVPARFLVPILLVAYLAPFITVRAGIDRLLGGRRRSPTGAASRPPMKNVTPPSSPDRSDDAGFRPGS